MKRNGFTLIELLIVIAIIGILASLILASVATSRKKARDASVKNAVSQIRWQAEIAYDSLGGSYEDWTQVSEIQTELGILTAEIEKQHKQANIVTIRETQIQNYCVSVPQVLNSNKYYCLDASGILKNTGSACPADPNEDGDPIFKCPS